MYDIYETITYSCCCLSIQFRNLLFDLVEIESNLFQNLVLFDNTLQVDKKTGQSGQKANETVTSLDERIPEKVRN